MPVRPSFAIFRALLCDIVDCGGGDGGGGGEVGGEGGEEKRGEVEAGVDLIGTGLLVRRGCLASGTGLEVEALSLLAESPWGALGSARGR